MFISLLPSLNFDSHISNYTLKINGIKLNIKTNILYTLKDEQNYCQ